MNCLILNSYAGSLTIAAHQLGLNILGSYEDAAYGIAAQKLNFPKLRYVDRLPWPVQDLTGTLVIAHPPCAPFSVQSANRQGTSSDDFECHRRVMRYALGQRCEGLAIESVPGALQARAVYEEAAHEHGYDVFFLRVNSISFVPQWRPRVWVIFRREGTWRLSWHPTYRPLRAVLLEMGSPYAGPMMHLLARRVPTAYRHELTEVLSGREGHGNVLNLGKAYLGMMDVLDVRTRWNLHGYFTASMPRVLDPDGWAPTILKESTFYVDGRPLFREEYQGIMGFPIDYQWPMAWQHNKIGVYLSKGVCPPVAQWVLEQMRGSERAATHVMSTGEVLDLMPTKAEVLAKLRQPELIA